MRNTFGYYTDLCFCGIEVNENVLTEDSIEYIGETFHSEVKIIE